MKKEILENNKMHFLFNIFANFIIIWQASYSLFINQLITIYPDSEKYIAMSKSISNNLVTPHTSFRIGLPIIANIVSNIVEFLGKIFNINLIIYSIQNDFAITGAFYLINLFISSIVFILLYKLLASLKIRVIFILFIIYIFQLNTTYLNMVSIPNADIAVILFITIQLYIALKFFPIKKNILIFYVFSLISIFFKEYIYLAVLPSFIFFIQKTKIKLYKKYILISLYISSLTIFYSLYKKIFNFLTEPYSSKRYLDYFKSDFDVLLSGLFSFHINFQSIQNFIQYSPLLIICIFIYSLQSKIFKDKLLSNKTLIFLPFIIFFILCGISGYPIRIFYPFYIYSLIFIPYSPIINNYKIKRS